MAQRGWGGIWGKRIRQARPPDTPMALVQQATTPRQKEFIGTLATMTQVIEKEEIKPPTLIVVGEVVRLHKQFSWFEPHSYYGEK